MASKLNKNKIITAAQKYVQKGQYDKAIREYTKIVEEDPRDVRIWLKIGDLHAKKKSRKEAVDTYSKVAEFYSEQGFYLKAVAVYKQILKIDSSLVEINLRLAELYKQLGLLSDAMQQYEHVSNHFNQVGRTKEALAALRQIVDLDPENVASRIKLAELYSKEGMREEAIEEFSKASDFLRADNRIDDFVKVAERLVFHQPNNMLISRELAGIYLQKNDPRRALQKLQLAFKADPRDVDTLEMLAQAFENLGQVAKTVSVLKELANIHGEEGNPDQQRQTYSRILSLSPSDEDALKAMEQLNAFPSPFEEQAMEPEYQPPHQSPKVLERPGDYQDPVDGFYHEPIYHDSDKDYHNPDTEPAPFRGAEFDPSITFDGPTSSFEQSSSSYDDPETFIDDPFDLPGQYSSAPEQLETLDSATNPLNAEAPEHLDEDFQIYDADQQMEERGFTEDGSIDVAKIITEADVYVKYGLQDKALNHLLQVFETDPNNLEVHLKLKELYIKMNRYIEAGRELLFLGQLFMDSDRRSSAIYLNEALELDPDNREARSLLNQLEGSEVIKEFDQPMMEDDYNDIEPIDLDAEDIVEEIPIDSEDLLIEGGLTIDDRQLEELYTDHESEWSGKEPHDSISSHVVEPKGVIEVSGEKMETMEDGSSEVIHLGEEARLTDSQVKAYEEEESSRIEDDLEEAEFFIQQNLISEARAILEEVAARVPNHPLVEAKISEINDLENKANLPIIEEEPSSIRLANELADADFSDLGPAPVNSDYSVEDVFEEFKRGSEVQTSEEDFDTHYDLGIAYREMGLLDDAITEFKVAMRSRDKEVLCHMMIGLCYIQKEMISEAISQYKTGLYVEGITNRETIALYFELGQAYENLDDLREALYYYEKVAKKDPHFRDVANRVRQIQNQGEKNRLGVDDNDGGGNPDPSGDDIVSKVF